MRIRLAGTVVLCMIAGILGAQQMTVTDSDANVLMTVNDEGTTGSISLPLGPAPAAVTGKLYNQGGGLYWNGAELGTAASAGGWTHLTGRVHTSLTADNVGIGTSTPEFKLTLDDGETDDSGILARGKIGEGSTLTTSGPGTRFIWYPKMAAIRAGMVNSDEWDDSRIGKYSVAFGRSSVADTFYTVAIGDMASATATGGVAIGTNAEASGFYSIAMGSQPKARASYAVSIGDYTEATGMNSVAIGKSNAASGDAATAMGSFTNAIGKTSTAMGFYTNADSYLSFAIGRCNIGGGDPLNWNNEDPIFEIGSGENDALRENIFTVMKSGKVGILNDSPGHLLTMEEGGGGGYYTATTHQWVNGSTRAIKQDIRSNSVDLREVLNRLEIVNYRYRTEVAENPEAPFHIGFIAEDAPALLSGVNHDGQHVADCIGLLLAVVKEQQKEIDTLKAEMRK